MNYNEVKQVIFSVIVDTFGIDLKNFNENSSYSSDLGADSLDAVELMMEFELKFGISISDEEFGMFERDDKVSKSIDFICNKLNIPIENKQKMKVKCINQHHFKNIIEGNEYEVSEETVDFYIIKNTLGNTARYSKEYFEVISEPIIEDIDEVGVEDVVDFSIEWDDDYTNILINIQENEVKLEYYNVSSNCGVASYHGVNWLFENCNFNTDLFKKIIEEVIKTVSDRRNKAILIFSTNDEYSEIWTILDELMDLSTETIENPNSDNEIKLWIKYVY